MTRNETDDPLATPAKRQRIAKLIARAGLCSRRDAEAWIVAGRVSVNGAVLTSPALDVTADDAILVDDTPVPTAEKTRLFLFHKPRGLVSSDHDPEGRATVADYLRENWPEGPRVVTIGRLDINTEGLLLLTNDGGLARVLELPQTGWVRRYRVRAKGQANPADLDALAAGLTIDGADYAGIEAKLDRTQGANCWLTMGLREGKNREIKRVLEHLGLEVNRLIRLSFGPFQLLDLPEGAVEEVRTRVLRDQLGPSLASQAGVDLGETASPSLPLREVRESDRPRGSERPTRKDNARPQSANRRANFSPRPSQKDPPPPERQRPIPGTRKHVSTLRVAEQASNREGPRKRIERSDTRDRRDRTVAVERLVSPRDAASEPERRRHTRTVMPRTDKGFEARKPRPAARSPDQPSPRRHGDTAIRRTEDRPRGGLQDRAAGGPRTAGRSEGRRDVPRRHHESPSAQGKRERVSRSSEAQRDAAPAGRRRPTDRNKPRNAGPTRDRDDGADRRSSRDKPTKRPNSHQPAGKRTASRDGGGKARTATPRRDGPPRRGPRGKPRAPSKS